MTTTPLTVKPSPKYRKSLNLEQLQVLKLLHKFRFASSQHIAKYSDKPSAKNVQKRLRILEDQQLIAKRYDKSYKLKGRPAAYYLLPKGARAVATAGHRKATEPINIRAIYKDKAVSEAFIAHCLNILGAWLQLKTHYGDKLELFTQSNLRYEHYDHFPQPLPDAYIRLKTSQGEKQFFLDIFEETQPYFVLVRRTKKYIDYAGSGEWAVIETELPTILMATANTSVGKRLRKTIARQLTDSWEDDLKIATTTLPKLLNCDRAIGNKIWRPVDEDGDDPDEPIKAVSLSAL